MLFTVYISFRQNFCDSITQVPFLSVMFVFVLYIKIKHKF